MLGISSYNCKIIAKGSFLILSLMFLYVSIYWHILLLEFHNTPAL